MRKLIYTLWGIVTYLLLSNVIFIYNTNLNLILKIFLTIALLMSFMIYQVIPFNKQGIDRRLNILMAGYELVMVTCIGGIIQSTFLVYLLLKGFNAGSDIAIYISGIILSLLLGFVMAVNGFIRIMITSKQLKFFLRLIWMMFWWVPVVNIIISINVCHKISREYHIEVAKKELNAVRKENEICHTKYPVLLVHGVFFRDWQYFNYWGRIPSELQRNGCEIYYGRHQSAAAVKDSAKELAVKIKFIVEETGCEKVNIIAHSKGGLDTKYAISQYGMAPYVASLTTINTPHKGCKWVDNLLKKVPKGLLNYVAEKYNKLFTKLGDNNPDFIAAVHDLTYTNCMINNVEIPQNSGILQQSVMSLMQSPASASFPLNLGFLLVNPIEGKNDGLVSEDSAKWSNYLGTLTCKGKRGISHGDMIDLFRENINGFDVREYYCTLVKQLKDKGL